MLTMLYLNSSLRAANFADESSSLTFTGMMLMPLSCKASMKGSAAFNVLVTCPLLPVTITGRVDPLKAPKVTSLSLPSFTCRMRPATWILGNERSKGFSVHRGLVQTYVEAAKYLPLCFYLKLSRILKSIRLSSHALDSCEDP